MKRKFLNIISCFLALFIFIGSFVFYVPSCVSASVDVSSFPSVQFANGVDRAAYEAVIESLKLNDSLSDIGDCYILINVGNRCEFYIFKDFTQVRTAYDGYYGVNVECYIPSKYGKFENIQKTSVSTYNFTLSDFSYDYSRVLGVLPSTSNSFPYMPMGLNQSDQIYDHSPNVYCFYSSVTPPFNPDYSLTGVIVGFDFSVEAFTQWLIDTEKYKELPSYIGTQKLKSFVQFYHDWGSSNSIFIIRLVEWFMHFNIASQTIENRNIIKSTIDRLYQEYKNSAFVQINHDSSILPHHRKNIETNTTDHDLTLVTDDPNDDTLISILRDILRGVISIPNSIYDNTQAILAKLDQLNHNIIISNNGGASSGTDLNPVLNKMDDIILALGSDTVSVEIDQTTKDDTDDFFDDWNLQFSTALNNKFPVASQLRTFFTGFFERCGIDADLDGEVYQYYNPGVLTSSTVSLSSGTASEEDIVSDFLGKFDNSDPAFLDDASYHGVPDLSVSVGGQSVSIIDFRVYAKYRDKIHFIISFVIWTLYLLHLYKALPQIIGQVADVAVKTSDL